MKILLLEPYYTGSHATWAEGYAQHSQHQINILSLPGRFWKWRMHGGAVTLARQFLEAEAQPNLILATDMLDLTTFLALTRHKTQGIPTAIYFHENQLTYPWSPTDRDLEQKRDKHYGFINYTSALAADVVLFNSQYHLESFLGALPNLLKHFPDYNELASVEEIREKSQVLPLGLALQRFNKFKPTRRSWGQSLTDPSVIRSGVIRSGDRSQPRSGDRSQPRSGDRSQPRSGDRSQPTARQANKKPLLLWGHRWEYDKGPEEFFRALTVLSERGLEFELAVLGENFSRQPRIFLEAEKTLAKHIVQFGYAESFAEYATWLWRADIMPVTSNQDFFGASVIEALYCEAFPLLPKRLAYPYLIPTEVQTQCFYEDFDDLVERLQAAILDIEETRQFSLREVVGQYDWQVQHEMYDRAFLEWIQSKQ